MAIGSSACAGEVVYTFSGVVDADGRDQNGIFGMPGSLAGQGFTAVYRWNPAIRPAAITLGPNAQSVLGGPNFGSAQAIEGLLSINGQSFSFGTELGSLLRDNGIGAPSSGGGFDQIGAQAYGNDPYLGITILQTISNADLTNVVLPTAAPVSRPLSSFSIQRPDGGNASLFTDGSLSILGFSVETFGTITVATVPEPASWALLVIGFGVVGAAMRRSGSPSRSVI